MPHSSYPVALDLYGKRCLVVGGGALALEKTEGLLRAHADVLVVDPHPQAHLRELAASGAIALEVRSYTPDDLDGAFLAYGASDHRPLNARVAVDARAAGVLVNAVDDIPYCDFFAVSIVRRGDLQVAISTNGGSPAFARRMREELDVALPAELGPLLDILADVRQEVRSRGEAPPYDRWKAAMTDDVLLLIRNGDMQGARARILADLTGDGSALHDELYRQAG